MSILLAILSPVPLSEFSPMNICLEEGRREGVGGKQRK